MAISLVDTAVPMNDTGYPVARAKHIWLDNDISLQKAIDDGLISGDDSTILTEQEYNELPEEEKIKGTFYLYDTGKIFKNSVQYGVTEPVELTYQEYSDMKERGLIDPDQEYIVSADAEGIFLEASDIGYSNAVSNLNVTTVQGAIDKVNDKVDNLIDDEVSDSTVWSSKKTSDEIKNVNMIATNAAIEVAHKASINDTASSTTSTWSSSKIASEINPTIDTSKVFSDGTLNIATLCSTYGNGRYVIVGQGTTGNGSATIDIWTLVGGVISYIVNALYSPKTSTMFVGYTYENPTIDFDANYLSACNHIAKVCTLA